MDFFPCCLQTVLPVVGKGMLRKARKGGKESRCWTWEQSLGMLMCPYPAVLGTTLGQPLLSRTCVPAPSCTCPSCFRVGSASKQSLSDVGVGSVLGSS